MVKSEVYVSTDQARGFRDSYVIAMQQSGQHEKPKQ